MTADPHILSYAPYVNVNALLGRRNEFKAMVIKGIVPEQERTVVAVDRFIENDALSSLVPGGNNIIIGTTIAEKFDIKKGDRLNFMVSVNSTAQKLSTPKSISFTVSATTTAKPCPQP